MGYEKFAIGNNRSVDGQHMVRLFEENRSRPTNHKMKGRWRAHLSHTGQINHPLLSYTQNTTILS